MKYKFEQIGKSYLLGYNMAMEAGDSESIAQQLNTIDSEFRPFGYEGAGTGLTLLDYLMPWSQGRLQVFIEGPGATYKYGIHTGAGWVFARLRWLGRKPFAQLDPLHHWLVFDGFGCHEGCFHWQRYTRKQTFPGSLIGYERRAFDQGFGRSIWLMENADVSRVAATIAAFPSTRQADLWSGVGAACSCAGGGEAVDMEVLRAAAGPHLPHLAQGVTFGARVRQLSGNPAPYTELACLILCGMSAQDAANITTTTLKDLPPDDEVPAFEVWRQRIQAHFSGM